MDADMERPESRYFKNDPLSMVRANRGQYVAAILTIAWAYIVAGTPNLLLPRPSFEGWSKFVRSPLVWLGRADPDNTIATVAEEDPIQQRRAEVFEAWAIELGCQGEYRTKELIEKADTCAAWRDALLSIAKSRMDANLVDRNRLGAWLRENKSTIAAGYKLSVDQRDQQRPRWSLRPQR
jgi:putative DNA primase/helicase